MIGIDIESVSRFDNLYSKKISLLQKMFKKYEWEYAITKANPSQTLAGIWCAKEAVVKALNPIKHVFIKDITIKHRETGAPYVELNSDEINATSIHISISHAKDYATAVAFLST